MEIVSYVLDGVLEHRDSMGNGSQMRPGDVQLMSAGRGVTHSEFKRLRGDAALPSDVGLSAQGRHPATYEQKNFTKEERRGQLRLVVSPDGEGGSLTIGQDARLFAGLFGANEDAEHEVPAGRSAWLHVARGSVMLNGEELRPGDGAAIQPETKLELRGVEDAEVVLWEVAAA